MRELTAHELTTIAAGTSYENWQTVALSGAAAGLAFGSWDLFTKGSLAVGLSTFAYIGIPTALVAGTIIGGVELAKWVQDKNSVRVVAPISYRL